MLYYANGGPGPASKLFRVDAPDGGAADGGADRTKWTKWFQAPAARWEPNHGWLPYPDAQAEILTSGEMFLVDASQVEQIQQEITGELEKALKRFSAFG